VTDSLAPQGIGSMQSTPPNEDVPSFGDMFKSAIDTVSDNQSAASDIATRYEMGDPEVDLPEVMIALQKSSVSFQAMTEVRNKMVEAYKEIMNMPI
jgi:flagellar hook-basal body complex protein FliE